jgi:histone H3/H4
MSEISFWLIRRIMHKDAKKVTNEAVKVMQKRTIAFVTTVTKEAEEICKSNGRSIVSTFDIELAMRRIVKQWWTMYFGT